MTGAVLGPDGLRRPAWAATDPMLQQYYDHEWGMPITDEQGLYERVSLEAFQAGLSWAIILRKRDGFRAAFHDFTPKPSPHSVKMTWNDSWPTRESCAIA